ncbi:hypothetical protein B0H10DRAFT_2230524 [Mycena sp. CBHHK59/15]|nr:hypothetical protein B0H10DRAFT_2230524 [Mycena sp. CBHHK59/15]
MTHRLRSGVGLYAVGFILNRTQIAAIAKRAFAPDFLASHGDDPVLAFKWHIRQHHCQALVTVDPERFLVAVHFYPMYLILECGAIFHLVSFNQSPWAKLLEGIKIRLLQTWKYPAARYAQQSEICIFNSWFERPSSQPTYPLNTSGYKGSGRTKGIKSSATGVPDGPRNTQRQLEVNQSTSRATREVPAAQFDQFLEFLASTTTVAYSQGEASSNPHTPINPKRKKKSVVIQSPPPQVPDINESETESEHAPKKKRLTKKEKGKGKAVGSDAESVPAIGKVRNVCETTAPEAGEVFTRTSFTG